MKKTLKSFALCILSALMILSSLQIFHLDVQAETKGTLIATVIKGNNSSVSYYQSDKEDVIQAFSRMWKENVMTDDQDADRYVSITLEADWAGASIYNETGYLPVPNGHFVTLDLNGHIMNRFLTNDAKSYQKNGEVIYINSDASLTIEDTNATTEHLGRVLNNLWYPGTGVNSNPTLLTLNGGIITGGANSGNGGGVVVDEYGTFTMHGGTLTGNMTSAGGGGISVNGTNAKAVIDGGHVLYNRSKGNGGGVYTDNSGFLALISGDISYNTSTDYYGGGIYNNSGALVSGYIDGVSSAIAMTGGSVCHNTAQYGGGVYQESGNVCLNGGTISNNTAAVNGGGIYANGHNGTTIGVHLNGVTVSYNEAEKYGGGFYVNTGYAEIKSAVINYNSAGSKEGSGVYMANADYISLTGGRIVIQDNGTSNLLLQNSKDLLSLSLGTDSCVYIGSRDFNPSTGDYELITTDLPTGDINLNYLHSDYSGYIISKSNSHVFFLKGEESKAPGTDSAPTETEVKGYTYSVNRGTFQYTSVLDSTDLSSVYYYSDGYFMNSSEDYGTQLSTLSINFAMAAFQRPKANDTDTYSSAYASKNITDLFDATGFSNYQIDYPEPAETENGYTIGSAIASKELYTENQRDTGKKLIVVAVRGANYTKEWGSNVTIGSSGEAEGFANAADQVTARVNDYISKNGTGEKYAIWVVGYSRGGATANLTSQRLSDIYGSDHVYGYTFEAPQGGTTDQGTHLKAYNAYTNIHNIINKSDVVPMVAPTLMGLVRYGVDHYIPSTSSDSDNSSDYYKVTKTTSGDYSDFKKKALLQLVALDPRIAFDDDFYLGQMEYVTTAIGNGHLASTVDNPAYPQMEAEDWYSDFLEYFIDHGLGIASSADASEKRLQYTRSKWYVLFSNNEEKTGTVPSLISESDFATYHVGTPVSFQSALQSVIGFVFGLSDTKKSELIATITDTLSKADKVEIAKFWYKTVVGNWSGFNLQTKNQWIQWAYNTVFSADVQSAIGEDEMENLEICFPVVLDVLLTVVSDDYNGVSGGTPEYIGTLVNNKTTVAEAHYPENNLAWLRAADSNYANDYAVNAKTVSFTVPNSPTADLRETTYETAQTLHLSSTTSGATIYYTLDGTTPSITSNTTLAYGQSIGLDSETQEQKNITVKAVSYKDGVYSEVSTFSYTIFKGAVKHVVRANGSRVGDYYPGEIVSITPLSKYSTDFTNTDKIFTGWTAKDEDGNTVDLSNPGSLTTQFVMGSSNVYATPSFQNKITNVDLTLNTGSDSIEDAISIPWEMNNSTQYYRSAGYTGTKTYVSADEKDAAATWTVDSQNNTAKLSVTIPDNTDSKRIYDVDAQGNAKVSVTVNGKTIDGATVTVNTDGSLTYTAAFTIKQHVKTLLDPQAITLAHSDTDLPQWTPGTVTTTILTKEGNTIVDVPLTFSDTELAKIREGYKASTQTEQSFPNIKGTIDSTYITEHQSTLAGTDSASAELKVIFSAKEKGFVDAPNADHDSGSILQTSDTITLHSDTEGASIYYTLDGKDPTSSSTEYTGPISTPASAAALHIKAVAYHRTDTSSISDFQYTVESTKVQKTLTIEAYDTAKPTVLMQSSQADYELNSTISVTAPAIANEEFLQWENSDQTLLSEDRTISVTMDDAKTLRAIYIPSVSSINIVIDKPNGGDSLAESIDVAAATITNTYYIDPADCEVNWYPSDNTAQYGITYTALIDVMPDSSGEIGVSSTEGGSYNRISAQYSWNRNAKITVNGEEAMLQSDEYGDYVLVDFPTDNLTYTGVSKNSYEMTVDNGTEINSIPLPTSAAVTAKDTANASHEIAADITEWKLKDGSSYDPSSLNEQTLTFTGKVNLPNGVVISGNEDQRTVDVTCTVTVKAADSVGHVTADVENNSTLTEQKTVTLSCDTEDADIYYKVYKNGDEIPSEYTEDSFAVLGGVAGSTVTYHIAAHAEKDGMKQIADDVFTYTVSLPEGYPVLKQPPLADGTLGDAYTETIADSNNPEDTVYMLAYDFLPAGLTLDQNTGVISGIPQMAGTYYFSIEATNSVSTSHVDYMITIADEGGTIEPYKFTKGADQDWEQGSSSALYFETDGPYSIFKELYIDGVQVDEDLYTAWFGSTKLTLSPELLKTLSLGQHTIMADYQNGQQPTTVFNVIEASNEPKPSKCLGDAYWDEKTQACVVYDPSEIPDTSVK
ncbi:MAG: chitobiase/beta-hexosaminidase C-terminal domain-containing protein [Solobacterium sp.]|jgi:hypothetical protein|nr:chitobiase/beta-hexosaminidase C-terminal domain-containing protein [Solobacterium sp.]MCH4205387.1 chitobiase/beta-hexosaminidase C-terminal domain-containing protein [Solobacterium sp.]MCH4226916.1 chitobiase/beta-hexosaminidase C-terminal domain-containing protein [Solobacterium sp.]MCH4282292.1 chitobiase/beta-hexosaminidase C-terminal domain-containing protein [Solobacterium sp.]